MPVWHVYHPENAYTAEDKIELGKRITNIYVDNFDLNLPRFYVGVFFHGIARESYIVGGEARDRSVHIDILHIARSHDQVAERVGLLLAEVNKIFLKVAHEALNPYVKDRGYESELYVQQTDRETWQIDGMVPPPSWSEAERQWGKENHSSPYDAALQ
ncbi:tautomerase family protein [Pseudonocardia eucalypti]|uniref:Tautomerase family protein n=1 Tax=Pseudonocardia eucalypti TaxID=648755 RepID=A0ABP9QWV5_9PSEU|nr:phenylpyruvate tautomerase PptA (4-oxalocrotonate tautomerase family) [Pseudonocardia eucalypti]